MSTPEHIWAWRYTGDHNNGQWSRSELGYAEARYIRADLAEAAIAKLEAQLSSLQAQRDMWQRQGREDALREAAAICGVWHRKSCDRADAAQAWEEELRHGECASTSGSLRREILALIGDKP